MKKVTRTMLNRVRPTKIVHPSRLLALPVEVRLRVFEILFCSSNLSDIIKPSKITRAMSCSAQILRVCRRLQEEGTPVFYSQTYAKKAVHCPVSSHRTLSALAALSDEARGIIKRLRIDGYPWPEQLTPYTSLETLDFDYSASKDCVRGNRERDRELLSRKIVVHLTELFSSKDLSSVDYIRAMKRAVAAQARIRFVVYPRLDGRGDRIQQISEAIHVVSTVSS